MLKRKRDETSSLTSEEVAFPRGGGTILSPLEIRQVTNEAAKEAAASSSSDLFGPAKPKKIKNTTDKPKKSKKSKAAKNESSGDLEDSKKVRIESVTGHLLKQNPGSSVLARINNIADHFLQVSLPNNLFGEIFLGNINEQIKQKLAKLSENLEDDDEGDLDEDDNDDDEEDLNASMYGFQIGQWIRVAPIAKDETTTTTRKAISLTSSPEVVNQAISDEDMLKPDLLVQGCVQSVEDHGAIISLGREGLSGFVARSKNATTQNEDWLVPGHVRLFRILSSSGPSDRKVVKLSADLTGKPTLGLESVKSLVAGTLVNALVTDVLDKEGYSVKIFGTFDGTLDNVHSGFAGSQAAPSIGDTVPARVIFVQAQRRFDFDETVDPKIMLSVLPEITKLTGSVNEEVSTAFQPGQFIENAKIIAYAPHNLGVYIDLRGSSSKNETQELRAFVHISRVADKPIEDLEAAFPLGSVHRARILDYSPFDNLYIAGLADRIINQKFIRVSEIPAGEQFKGMVTGITKNGSLQLVLENLEGSLPAKAKAAPKYDFDDILKPRAFVGPLHISDVKLKNPELKYPVGSIVKCRVLSHARNGSLRMSLKKSIVNSTEKTFTSVDDMADSIDGTTKIPTTIVKIQDRGAIVEFIGGFTGFLPLSEMSEAFVEHPSKIFKLGQTVGVFLKDVDPEIGKVIVTCKTHSFGGAADGASDASKAGELVPGKSVVEGKILEKTVNGVTLDINGARGVLSKEQINDDFSKAKSVLKKLQVGDSLEVVILQISKRGIISVSSKKSLLDEAKAGGLLSSYAQAAGAASIQAFHGYITNVNDTGAFVGFSAGVVGLIMKQDIPGQMWKRLTNSFSGMESVTCYIRKFDKSNNRIFLSLSPVQQKPGVNSLSHGQVVKVTINSVKRTQLNVSINGGSEKGRIDISEAFESFKQIKDTKNPLSKFNKGQELEVRVVGLHDARNHRFLPISQRHRGYEVYELSMRSSSSNNETIMADSDIEEGKVYTGYINNIGADFAWINISPTIRGRISLLDLTNDTSLVDSDESIVKNFPIGTAIRCVVKSKTPQLRFRVTDVETKSFNELNVGDVLPGIVAKVHDLFLTIRLSDDVVATAYITDLADSYGANLTAKYEMQNICAVKVVEIDESNKRVYVSLRPSVVQNGTAAETVVDPVIDAPVVDAVVRGFVKNVADGGLFVSLSRTLVARVQIKNLSDEYLNEWKKFFHIGQLVEGRIVSVDGKGRVEMTLKKSALGGDKNQSQGGSLSSVEVGAVYSGLVKKVEDYGVFVSLDGLGNVSGLCHRSEVADIPLHNLGKVFSEGDRVKVKVLKVDLEKNRMALGMKASYFGDEDTNMADSSEQSGSESGNGLSIEAFEDSSDEEMDEESEEDSDSDDDEEEDESSESEASEAEGESDGAGLGAAFDWTASIFDQMKPDDLSEEESDSDDELDTKRKKRRAKNQVSEDKTATLSTKLPQSVSDFERLLIGSPNSSVIWMNYMAFQLQLSEVEKAREIGKRALKTIGIRFEDEKMNIWVALLNLENSFGTTEALDETFKEACQFMDPKIVHVKMANILGATSGKLDKAKEVYDAAVKKFGRADPTLWVSYGQFLFNHDDKDAARTLLDKALRSISNLPNVNQVQRDIITKFAVMEYTSGDLERGRTLFEGLVASYPRRVDIWNVYIDQELKKADKPYITRVFERVVGVKLSQKQAKFFFKKWLAYEAKHGDDKSEDYVKAKAAEYVSKVVKEQE